MASEAQVDAMIQESWRLLHQLLFTGTMTLKNKAVVVPSPELLIRSIADIAKLKPPKVRKVANTDQLRIAGTLKKTVQPSPDAAPDGG